jgi:hypothetical protein
LTLLIWSLKTNSVCYLCQIWIGIFDYKILGGSEQRARDIQQLIEHLKSILKGKDTLTSFVQRPHSNEQNLLVEAPNQRFRFNPHCLFFSKDDMFILSWIGSSVTYFNKWLRIFDQCQVLSLVFSGQQNFGCWTIKR